MSAPPTNGRTFQVTGWNNGNVTFTPSGGTGRINGTSIAGGLTGRDSNAAATYSGTLSFSCPWASIAVPMNPVT
ncbi:hypothetical protein CL86_gp008 [Mycobacterium phage SkiPole]|uniref:Minor tail protein n=1 Tax=Mycobacterium phage SkiPole TaxID=701456 RepID=D2XRK2_9CAUD|nr:hypothetical protein CL86_gp008 [Mycobacterium phage SkiPole]ADA83734.1 hypothetical protein SKIPOLE_8 [Mycobacterium phage SkiPole]